MFLTASWGGSAAAQSCDPSIVELEERAAQALNIASRHEEALARFEAIARRCQLPRTLARLAITEAAMGRWGDADTHIRAALAANDPWITAHRSPLEAEAARIAAHIGALFVVGRGPAGTLFVDGERFAPWPMSSPARIPAGTLRLRVEAEGCEPVERVVRVEVGLVAREEVALRPIPRPDPGVASVTAIVPPASPSVTVARSRTPSHRGRPWIIAGATGMALGVGLVAVGVITSVLRADALDELRGSGCYGPTPMVARCDEIANRVDDHANWAVAGFTSGGVMTALSVGAFVLAAVNTRRDERAFRCAPTLGTVGAACGLTF